MKRLRLVTRARQGAITGIAAALISAAVFGGGASTATADTPCQDRVTSTPFSFLGDWNQYFSAPNGHFDTTAEWTYYGDARAVSGVGSPVNLAKGSTSRAGFVGQWATMLSTWTCVRGNEDSVRFLVKPTGTNPGKLVLNLYVSDPASRDGWTVKQVTIDPANAGTHVGSGWYVTPRIMVPWSPYWDNTQWISFNFHVPSSGSGGWYVDDVMIDPWRTN